MTSFVRGSMLQWLGWAAALAAIVVTLGSAAGTQSTATSAASARAAVEKAFRAGKFDEVHTLAQASAGDEAIAILNAKAYVSQGDHPKAEALLTPLAATKPAGDAALELGLLQFYLGRRSEARRTMTLLMLADVREANARDYARAARAARALGRFEEANSFFREAIAIAPNDAPINDISWRIP